MTIYEILGLILFLSLIPILINILVVSQVFMFSSKSLRLSEVSDKEFPLRLLEKEQWDVWSQEYEFEWIGVYSLKVMQIAYIRAWRSTSGSRYFCIYNIANQTIFDFVSIFSNEFSLTTSSTKDGQMMPSAPGKYMQTLENLTVEEQYQRHLETEQFLISRYRMRPMEVKVPFENMFIGSIQKQMAYIRTIPLWPILGSYWYFVRRRRFKNLTVQQQLERGMVTPPENIL